MIMKISEAVSKRIDELLYAKNLSWYKLEFLTGLNRGTITGIQYAKYKGINLTTLTVIIRALGLSVKDFFDSPLFDEENLD